MDLKILIATPSFPPIVNGVSIYVYRLVDSLMKSGVHTCVHTIGGNNSLKRPDIQLDFEHFDVVSSKGVFDFGELSGYQPMSLSYLTSTLKACKDFDVVHVHDSPKVCNDLLIFLMRKLRSNKPVVFTPHGAFVSVPAYEGAFVSSSMHKLSSKMYWSLGIPQRVLRSADQVIAVNPLQARLFAEVCGSRKVSFIPEAVPSCYFAEKPTFTNDEKLKILFIGRIAEEKGIKDLLLAIHKMITTLNNGNDLELVCVGPDYGYSQEVHKTINDLKLNRSVKMLGPLPEDEKLYYLSWCDVLVLPSHFEAFGLPILEAMAHGKPVIATETFGSKSLITHMETGFLVKIGDSDSIAQALLKLWEDPELKYRMGDKALKHASKFRMKSLIERHIILYETLMHRPLENMA